MLDRLKLLPWNFDRCVYLDFCLRPWQ